MVHCTRYVAQRMIDLFGVPPPFLRDDFRTIVDVAYTLDYTCEELKEVPIQSKSLVEILSSVDSFPVAMVVEFPETDSVMCIVGSPEHYYFIDIFHEICYATKTPEYDIVAYVEEHGSDLFRVKSYQKSSTSHDDFKIPLEEPTVATAAAPPPAVKKRKTVKTLKPLINV